MTDLFFQGAQKTTKTKLTDRYGVEWSVKTYIIPATKCKVKVYERVEITD